MISLRQLLTVATVVACASLAPTSVSAHPLPVPHVDSAPPQELSGQALGHSVGFVPPQAPSRHLRVQHAGEDHGAQPQGQGGAMPPGNVIPPGGGDVNPNTGVKNPGGILGPLYSAFPGLLAPLAMASDNIHNSNAAVSGVQHTPDGIFQA